VRTRRLLCFVTLTAVCALVAVACDGATESIEVNDAFCEARVRFEAVLSVETPDQRAIDRALDQFSASAPAELEDDVTSLVDTVRNRPEEAFASTEFHDTQRTVDDAVVADCDFETYDVTGEEFSFDGVPTEVAAGTVAFEFSNQGELEHDMAVFRIDDSVHASVGELLQLPPSQAQTILTFSNAAHAASGAVNTSIADLAPGRYAVVCLVALEDGSQPHFTEGMFTEFRVV
jgi:hypothetical protein